MRLTAKQLRKKQPTSEELAQIKRNPIYIILDNVLDTYNTGSIFRLADAVAAKKIFLCGETETPPNPKILKASVGTFRWVPWEYQKTALKAVEKLRKNIPQIQILAVEQSKNSILYTKYKPKFPLALVVGNETYGVSQQVLQTADYILEIPLFGVNKSLNVMVSLAIVLFQIIQSLPRK